MNVENCEKIVLPVVGGFCEFRDLVFSELVARRFPTGYEAITPILKRVNLSLRRKPDILTFFLCWLSVTSR